ncbi:hypothetical protein [Nocardia amikacinitolerans]|uniref:hypothetical protein n=1 Tax=Nocardia amikacinitolerans TaxID=756689 RepID=UPI0020A28D19|nr:hypothetical protein [Nocardia amikacinitolerans]MCP2287209.1 hypothetical protein [Nocardia amikacinitolerans]
MKAVLPQALPVAALVVPARSASAAPHPEPAPIADSGSASTGSAAQNLCRLLRMLQAGYVDSSGGPCTLP